MLLFLWLTSILSCCSIATNLFDSGVSNVCNSDVSDLNCEERALDSSQYQYECIEIFESQNTICGCAPSAESSVIIIIDASNHTRNEWRFITLRWLQLYYDTIYSSQSHDLHVYYMLSHGDFTLMSLNEQLSDLASDSFMDNLDELAVPNACVAFKRTNEWLSDHPDIANNTAIIYYAKTTPFAPTFTYKCRDEDVDEEHYTLIRSKDIFAIKYTEDININYVQRDIGEFANEVSIFPNDEYEQSAIIEQSIETEEIASIIAATVSDFVCAKAGDTLETPPLVLAPSNKKSDCCVHVSGVEYTEITSCDIGNIQEIEQQLNVNNCLYFCNPFESYAEENERNWECIANYALWVQFYHVCADLNEDNKVNGTLWNDYRWHCPICYNVSVDAYKTVCRSNDGQEAILDAYVAENCDCSDVTLFLVVIIEITALVCILIGMFALWYRFNVTLIKQHLKHEAAQAVNMHNIPEEVILNDINDDDDDGMDDSDTD